MDQQQLKNVLENHRKWVLGESDGERANLSNADLSNANLSNAYLRYANLSDANLSNADLSNADLSNANLSNANLSNAYLRYANLSDAYLRYANLSNANLSNAYLRYANLSDANLSNANLSNADLSDIKKDFLKVLSIAKTEVLGLYDALMRGKISGSQYEGDCACLVGTVANVRNEHFKKLSIELKPDADRLSERWFLGISKGDIPQNNAVSELTAEWTREFMDKKGIKYPNYEIQAVWP